MLNVTVAGDMMLGRAVDLMLDFPTDQTLYESSVKNAREYITLIQKRLKEEHKTKLMKPPLFWKPLMLEFHQLKSDLFCVNLETAITNRLTPWPKGINYKMSTKNIYILHELQKDIFPAQLVLSLANNHLLDWCRGGLLDTLRILRRNQFLCVGAGTNLQEAIQPVTLDIRGKTVAVWACGHPSAGIDKKWAATATRSGIFFVSDPEQGLQMLTQSLQQQQELRKNFTVKILLVHWGPNFVDQVDASFQKFARSAIKKLGFQLIVNTSSHHRLSNEWVMDEKNQKHVLGIIVHGPGDFISDYYGIRNTSSHADKDTNQGSLINCVWHKTDLKVKSLDFQRIGFDLFPSQKHV